MSGDYEVGHGKPPLHSRFKKGRSGNPKGRPKGTKSLNTLLAEQLRRPIQAKVGGRVRTITTAQALAMRMVERALQGDAKTLRLLLDEDQRRAGAEGTAPVNPEVLAAEDEEILRRYLAPPARKRR